MKTFVLFVAIILPNGELEINHKVVDECPTDGFFEAAMETKKIHGEFISWSAACFYLDMEVPNKT